MNFIATPAYPCVFRLRLLLLSPPHHHHSSSQFREAVNVAERREGGTKGGKESVNEVRIEGGRAGENVNEEGREE